MRKPPSHLVAREGWILIAAAGLLMILAVRLSSVGLGVLALILLVLLIMLFRDPHRTIPSLPLAVLAPLDGTIKSIEHTDRGCLDREATCITMRVDNFGAYSARAPVEGKVLNLQDNYNDGSRLVGVSGLWLRTDEDDDVVMLIDGPRWLRPRSFVGYGERLGQGRRFAFVRIATTARIFIPITSRVEVNRGDYVRSGEDALAMLIHDADEAV
ncbi:MAG: hypothetical protein HKN49_00480 [Gammaproteobacteria bacterium]|nr:hypothetical protein [Gammaproteobacteria bacterium]